MSVLWPFGGHPTVVIHLSTSISSKGIIYNARYIEVYIYSPTPNESPCPERVWRWISWHQSFILSVRLINVCADEVSASGAGIESNTLHKLTSVTQVIYWSEIFLTDQETLFALLELSHLEHSSMWLIIKNKNKKTLKIECLQNKGFTTIESV